MQVTIETERFPYSAHLSRLTTEQTLQFESSGEKHNFNFQISQAIPTEWQSGMHRGIDIVAPGHVSLNAAQEASVVLLRQSRMLFHYTYKSARNGYGKFVNGNRSEWGMRQES